MSGRVFSVRVPGPGGGHGTLGLSCDSRLLLRVSPGASHLLLKLTPPPDSHTTICGHWHSEVVRQLKHAGAAFSQGLLFFFTQF